VLNLVTLAVAEQSNLSAEARWPISLFVEGAKTTIFGWLNSDPDARPTRPPGHAT
jgi:hypothetical protein